MVCVYIGQVTELHSKLIGQLQIGMEGEHEEEVSIFSSIIPFAVHYYIQIAEELENEKPQQDLDVNQVLFLFNTRFSLHVPPTRIVAVVKLQRMLLKLVIA